MDCVRFFGLGVILDLPTNDDNNCIYDDRMESQFDRSTCDFNRELYIMFDRQRAETCYVIQWWCVNSYACR